MKVFLSHSSSDKDIVGGVYKELGPAICHYDVATFDPCGFLPDQIYEALNESNYFIFFASEKALASEWVAGELRIAFINWMRSKVSTAMVFLLRGGRRADVPDWLQNYVITEHPSPIHIACRVLSQYDQWQTRESRLPPFYRSIEIKEIEKQITVEASKLPVCLFISGPDGMGRKELINELFGRQFRNVPSRKILLYSESFDSDVDIFKHLKGLLGLTTARELVASIEDYRSEPIDIRIERLAALIVEVCGGAQTLIVEAAESILNDSGELTEWMACLINKMPVGAYPLLNIVTNRRPSYIESSITNRIVASHLEPLPADESELLFAWWTSQLKLDLPPYISEMILDQVAGNPALIASAARLVKSIPDSSDIRQIKKYVFSDLEASAAKFIKRIADDEISKLMLAFVADCGHIASSDLFSIIASVKKIEIETIRKRFFLLQSYGFLQPDATSVKVPNFLARTARALGKNSSVQSDLKRAWVALTESLEKISLDEETNIALLNEACIVKLKSGQNSIPGIESLILPSQCLRVARKLYDSNDYKKAYELCVQAYRSRIALTEDGAIEALRYRGMAAARINNQDFLRETIALFKEHSGNRRSRRISEFVLGFNHRLDGKFDDALRHMQVSLDMKGADDIHLLRELAYLYLATNDPAKAKVYIGRAKSRAKNNSYITELQVLIELAFGKNHAILHEKMIADLIEELEGMGSQSGAVSAFRSKIRFLITTGDQHEARRLFNSDSKFGNGNSSVGVRLLDAQILMAENKYQVAQNELAKLKSRVLSSKDSQRRSILPLVIDLLIQSASGVSVPTGIFEFTQNFKYLPLSLQARARNDLKEIAAFSKYKLSEKEKVAIGIL